MNMWKYDLIRYNLPGKFKFFKALLIPGFKYTLIIRLIQSNSIFKPLYKTLWRFYSIQIQYKTSIGKGFYIGHFGNIVVNGNCKIGNNCNIAQGVTLGATNRGERKGAPIIGNEVWIGTNAVIVGKIIIGNNVLIAPNSYVNIDIPDNSILVGNPCKIIYNDKATEGYINNKI